MFIRNLETKACPRHARCAREMLIDKYLDGSRVSAEFVCVLVHHLVEGLGGFLTYLNFSIAGHGWRETL